MQLKTNHRFNFYQKIILVNVFRGKRDLVGVLNEGVLAVGVCDAAQREDREHREVVHDALAEAFVLCLAP